MTVRFVSESHSHANTHGKGGIEYTVDNLFGRVLVDAAGPQVFLVHQSPNDTTHPHYHSVPQFQVFTRGGGRFGRTEVSAPLVHYADAYTPYGPIVSADDGVDYFTARITADVGAHYMPESRKEKSQRSGRHFTVSLDPHRQPASAAAEPLAEYDDGLAAYRIDLEAGDPLVLPPLRGAGRLVTVMTGSLRSGADEVRDWAWGYCGPGEDGDTGCTAGVEGATVLCFDYPQR